MVMRFGIDVSHYQGNFNFNQAKGSGVEYAILKIGGGDAGLYKDPKFDPNYEYCKRIGIPIGCYFFSRALTMQAAEKEVDYWLKLMRGKQFEYPVFLDVEGAMINVNRRELTDICKYMLDRVEKSGYWVGIYSSDYYFNNNLYDNELLDYTHWVASWGTKKPSLLSGAATQIWQFGGDVNKLRSNTICGVVCDQDFCYVDYPPLIKTNGLNGFIKQSTVTNESKEEAPITPNEQVSIPEPEIEVKPKHKYKKGDHVIFTQCHISSVNSEEDRVFPASKMSKDHGTITFINDNDNPYLLDNGMCWVSEKDISGYYVTIKDLAGKIGEKVRISEDAVYSNGGQIPSWVKKSKLYVRSVRPNGVDVVLSTVKTGAVTGVVNKKYIIL